MLPISTKEPARFTPPYLAGQNPKPVFVLAVPTVRERIALDADIVAEGVGFPSQAQLLAALRSGVAEHVVDAEQGPLNDLIDELEALGEAPAAGELGDKIEQLQRTLRPVHRPYAELEAERGRFVRLATLNRTERFLLAVEGEGAPQMERKAGRLTEASIDALAKAYGDAIFAILGAQIAALTQPTADQMGNSKSPPSLPSGPAISRAAKGRPTARAGTSLGKSTRKTRG